MILHIDRVTGVGQLLVEPGKTVYVAKNITYHDREEDSAAIGHPKLIPKEVRRMAGFDCVPMREMDGLLKSVTWVKASDHRQTVALFSYESGRLTDSTIVVQ